MASRRTLAIVAAAVIVIVIVASVGAYVVLTSGKKGTVQVYLSDSVGDWAHVNVTFSQVQVHQANSTNNSGWITLSIKNGTLDLTQLVNVSALLGEGSVPVGKYTQIRIDVQSATGVMTNGSEVTFTVPSGELKTATPFTVSSGQTTTLTVDIDLEHSITYANGTWIFKPVLGQVQSGTLQIYMKDAVGMWQDVNVTFSIVQVHMANSTNASGWINLTVNNGVLDLATLVNVSELLASGNLTAGMYTQIRIVVTNVTGVMVGGMPVNFTVPSGELKTTRPFNITANETTSLTLDVDLDHSITFANGSFIFKPVLGSITES